MDFYNNILQKEHTVFKTFKTFSVNINIITKLFDL